MSKGRQGLDWLLAENPTLRVHIKPFGIYWEHDLEGWVPQRGWPSYRVLLTDYDPEQNIDVWDEYAISRSGRVYRVLNGTAEPREIWKP